ncbi:hypothetical protein SLS62_001309 [Diatrype stigma]|uniref:Elongin-A n=1 Tax=Diatrype stigma TaxID=117547 RepID=A0AAN9UWJ7_9PEZI
MPPRVDVTDIGNMPYPTVRNILLQVNNAKQLRQLEENSPQLEGEDVECWTRLIKKDFPVLAKKHNFEPKNPASWYLIYAKYERLEAEQKREAEAKLKAAFAGLKKEKAENVSHIVASRKLPRPPKDGRGIPGGARRTGTGGRRPDDGDLRFTSGTRTKTTTGKGILRKAYREAREISARNRLATPTGLLPVRQGQIASAPKAMVEEARIKAQPAIRGGASGTSSGNRRPSTSGASTLLEQKRARELEEREARLRQLKNAKKGDTTKTTFVSDSDLEDEGDDGYSGARGRAQEQDNDDDDDDDPYNSNGLGGGLDVDELEDLFDEKPGSSSKPATSKTGTSTGRKLSLTPAKQSAARPAASTATSPASSVQRPIIPVVSKRRGILCNAHGSTRTDLKPVPRPRSRSNSTSASASTTTSKAASPSKPTSATATTASRQQPPKKLAYSPPVEKKQQSQQYPSPTKQSPPVASTTTASSASPELKPQASGSASAPAPAAPTPTMARKRKPVDVFMKPKPKMQKR